MYLRSHFVLGQPVSGESFFGRRRELAKILSLLQAGSAVNFFSLRRMGKSSLLLQIRYLTEHDGNWSQYQPIFLDLQGLSPDESLAEYLAWELGIGKGKRRGDNAWREVERYAKEVTGKSLLLIDEVGFWLQGEKRERDLAPLRALQQSRTLNIVASTLYLTIVEHIKHHSQLVSPFYNIFYSFRLPSFLPAEAVELLITLCDRGGITLGEDFARELAHYVGYYPNLVQEIGYTAFLRLSEGIAASPGEIATQWLEERGRHWLQTILSTFQWKYEDGIAESVQIEQKNFLVESLEDYGILLRDSTGTLKIAPYLKDLLRSRFY